MLRKVKSAGGKVKVTFSMPALEGVAALFLTGSFNDWAIPACPWCAAPTEGGARRSPSRRGGRTSTGSGTRTGTGTTTGPRIPTCPTSSAARTRWST